MLWWSIRRFGVYVFLWLSMGSFGNSIRGIWGGPMGHFWDPWQICWEGFWGLWFCLASIVFWEGLCFFCGAMFFCFEACLCVGVFVYHLNVDQAIFLHCYLK